MHDTNLSRFVAWTLAIAWGVGLPVVASSRGWLPVELPIELLLVLLLSPAVVAIVLTTRREGRPGLHHLLWRRGLRVSWRWWGIALVTPFAINAVALLLHAARGGAVPELPGTPAPEQQMVPVWLLPLVFLLYSAAEEVGWRRYALPRLQARTSALTASLLLGLVWFVWHLPLNLIPGSTQALPHGWYLAGLLAISVVFTGLYNSSGGSLAAVTMLHAGVQASNVVLPVMPSATGTAATYELAVVVQVLLAVGIVAAYGAGDLARSSRDLKVTSGIGAP